MNKIATIQLTTVARHQGWTTHSHEGSWSWFELAILKPKDPQFGPSVVVSDTHDSEPTIDWTNNEPDTLGDGEYGSDLENRIKRKENGSMLVWESHRIPVATGELVPLTGKEFSCNDEIFDHLEEGESIGVLCCAQRRFWECVGLVGDLKFRVFFEPVIPL